MGYKLKQNSRGGLPIPPARRKLICRGKKLISKKGGGEIIKMHKIYPCVNETVIAGDKSADSAAKSEDGGKAEETGSSEAAPEESKQGEDEDMKVGVCDVCRGVCNECILYRGVWRLGVRRIMTYSRMTCRI